MLLGWEDNNDYWTFWSCTTVLSLEVEQGATADRLSVLSTLDIALFEIKDLDQSRANYDMYVYR